MKKQTRSIRYGGASRLGAKLGMALFAAGLAGSALADTILPDPSTTVLGIPVATQFDDGYSYSTRLLDYLYPGSGWTDAAGTGLLDVIITTRSSGQTNSDIAGDIYSIPDPITNPNTSPISGTWGASDPGSTMLVKNLYDYLMATFNANTPIFTFDQNETGGNPDLFVSAKVEIIDGFGGAVLHTWSLDNDPQAGDGDYDPGSPITAPGEICVPDVMNDPSNTVCFNNNVGSGKFDYLIYVPTMDLTPWVDDNNLFKVSWIFSGVDDGGEEITLTGRFTEGNPCVANPGLPQCQTIPEPGSLALLGLALAMLSFVIRRKMP